MDCDDFFMSAIGSQKMEYIKHLFHYLYWRGALLYTETNDDDKKSRNRAKKDESSALARAYPQSLLNHGIVGRAESSESNSRGANSGESPAPVYCRKRRERKGTYFPLASPSCRIVNIVRSLPGSYRMRRILIIQYLHRATMEGFQILSNLDILFWRNNIFQKIFLYRLLLISLIFLSLFEKSYARGLLWIYLLSTRL